MIFDKSLFGTHRISITTTLHKAQTETNFSVNFSHTKVEVFQGSVVSGVAHLQGCRTQKECAQYVSSWICLYLRY